MIGRYHQRSKQTFRRAFGVAAFVVIVALFATRARMPRLFSAIANTAAHPFLVAARAFSSAGVETVSFLRSKTSLLEENAALREDNLSLKLALVDARRVTAENEQLAALRTDVPSDLVPAGVLLRPPVTMYDTLIIDAGSAAGVAKGNPVLVASGVVVGSVEDVFSRTSRVVLFSSPGTTLSVVFSGTGIAAEARGRGAGNFEVRLPRDISVISGDVVALPGISGGTLGVVSTIIAEEADSFQRVLFKSPVSLSELSFVLVDKGRRL